MIVSHAHRFIFIKTKKVAGTSVEVFLSPLCGEDDTLTPIDPQEAGHRPRNHEGFRNHMPAVEVRERVGPRVWDRYFKFCIERNPWDKVVSEFHMQRARNDPSLTFTQFIGTRRFPRNLQLYSEGGTVIVDRVLRYESLEGDLAEVFRTIGVPFGGGLGVRAKGQYRDDRRHYREYYTPEQAAVVAEAMADEIALHGYVF